jgi:hypothetical protein
LCAVAFGDGEYEFAFGVVAVACPLSHGQPVASKAAPDRSAAGLRQIDGMPREPRFG